MKNTEQIIRSGILEQFVLGLTTEEENKQIHRYIKQYPELNEHVLGIRTAMDRIISQYNIPPKKSMQPIQMQANSSVKSWLNQLVFFMIIMTIIIHFTLRF